MAEQAEFDPAMTLGEAMRKLRAAEPADFARETPVEIAQMVEQHDAVHVLFDCGTSLQDEIAAHVWMLLATNAKVREMHRAVASQEHRVAISGIGRLKLLRVWLLSLPRLLSIVVKSWRVERRVAMERLAELKEQPIAAIRRVHGIEL